MKNFEIIFADENIVVINKPPKLPVQKTVDKNRLALEILVNSHFHENLRLVNRIDVNTSGLVLFARENANNILINELFENSEKHYLCFAHNVPNENFFICEDFLKIIGEKTEVVRSGGKKAISHCQVIETQNNITLLAVQIFTGRRHQIRAQLAAKNHPLLSDFTYGKSSNKLIQRCALHAAKLVLPNYPEFIAPLPQDFLDALEIGNFSFFSQKHNH